MAAEEPEYYFAVARQPDLVNTALLDGNDVFRLIRYFSMSNSVATTSIVGRNIAEEILSPASLGVVCSAQIPGAISLSGTYVYSERIREGEYPTPCIQELFVEYMIFTIITVCTYTITKGHVLHKQLLHSSIGNTI